MGKKAQKTPYNLAGEAFLKRHANKFGWEKNTIQIWLGKKTPYSLAGGKLLKRHANKFGWGKNAIQFGWGKGPCKKTQKLQKSVCPDPQNRSIFKEKAPAKLYGVFQEKVEKSPSQTLWRFSKKKLKKNTIQFGWGKITETPR
jgi:hypothetical protein